MKLKKLLKNIRYKEIKGSQDIEILGISSDSRIVSPNNLFIARRGTKFDATQFIYDAIQAGAIAIVTDIYDPFLKNITQIICEDINLIEADLAANYYQNPSKELFSIAVSGTSGKTTTTYLIKSILDATNYSCGLLGSVEYILKENKIPSKLTTPDSLHIQKYLREMVNLGLKSVCMEASSHGIEQGRLKNIDFNIAIFTNLTSDHLDYHLTVENYKNAKKKLFDSLNEKAFAIINLDDKNSSDLVKNTKAKILTYAINQKADLFATDINYSFKGTSFSIVYEDKKVDFFTKLIGKFNVYNILCSVAAGIILNIDLEKIAEVISKFEKVSGRLEKVENAKGLHIYVDHAHKEDALQNVLSTLKELKKNRIINVFGCGGDRDKTKRPLMAKVSEKYADISIVTSDNPRSEDPEKIIEEIVKGFCNKNTYIIEKDRRKAIEIAIKLAKENDIIIITGKGHETYQIFKNMTIDFDDREVTKQICATI
jgi:UDP-N-acetylmuramoyl-L-alanyl-D-glutamate--2,6-diaminopimelate ligase